MGGVEFTGRGIYQVEEVSTSVGSAARGGVRILGGSEISGNHGFVLSV